MTEHSHPKETTVRVLTLPHDAGDKPQLKVIGNDLSQFQRMVGGFIEVVRNRLMPVLSCSCPTTLLVNEEANLRGMPYNAAASAFWPGDLRGDAVMVGEYYDMDEGLIWVSMPENFEL